MSGYRRADHDNSSDGSSSDDDCSTSSSSSTDYGDDPQWMEKFNIGIRKSGENAVLKTDRQVLKSANWMEKFERKNLDGELSTGTAKLSSDPDSKQNLDALRKPAGEEINTRAGLRKMENGYRKASSRYINKAERRKRIRQNLDELRRRARLRENPGNRKTQKKQKQKLDVFPIKNATVERPKENAIVERNDTPIAKRTLPHDRRDPSTHKNDRKFQSIPVTTKNQPATKISINPSEKSRIVARTDGKTATNEIPLSIAKKATRPPSNTNRGFKDLQFQWMNKEASKVTDDVQPAPSSTKKDAIKAPSIGSKLQFWKSTHNNNLNESAEHQKSINKKSVVKPHIFSPVQNQHAKLQSARINNTAPATTHQKTNSLSNNDDKGGETVDAKFHSHQVEIESSVPKNLFGMWGETVKAKKPNTANTSGMSKKMIMNQADRIKQRIDKAKKEGIQANGNRSEDVSDTDDEKSTGIKLDPNESASALFFGANGKKSDDDNPKGSGMDESIAILFGVNAAKNELSYDAGNSEVKEEINRETSMIVDAVAQSHDISSTKDAGENEEDEFECKKKNSDREISKDMASASRFDSVDSCKKEGEHEKEQVLGQTSRSADISDAIMPGAGTGTAVSKRGDDDEIESVKKEESDETNSIDAEPSSLLFGIGHAKRRNIPDLNSSSSILTESGIDSQEDILESKGRMEMPAYAKTSMEKSYLYDSSSFDSSTADTIQESSKNLLSSSNSSLKKKTPTDVQSNSLLKYQNSPKAKMSPKTDAKQKVGKKKKTIRKEEKNKSNKDGKVKSTGSSKKQGKSETNDAALEASQSFIEDGSFFASDFSTINDSPRVKQKNAKKSKEKSKLKKSRSDKKLSSKKLDKKK